MNGAFSTRGRAQKCLQNFSGDTRRGPFRRSGSRRDSNIKTDMKHDGCDPAGWIHLAAERDR